MTPAVAPPSPQPATADFPWRAASNSPASPDRGRRSAPQVCFAGFYLGSALVQLVPLGRRRDLRTAFQMQPRRPLRSRRSLLQKPSTVASERRVICGRALLQPSRVLRAPLSTACGIRGVARARRRMRHRISAVGHSNSARWCRAAGGDLRLPPGLPAKGGRSAGAGDRAGRAGADPEPQWPRFAGSATERQEERR